MAILDVFKSSAFSTQELTDAIRIIPNQYGKLNDMDLFPGRGVRTRSVSVEFGNGVLTLLDSKPVGSPGTVGKVGKRDVRSYAVPHFPHDDLVLAEDVQGIRSFGSENQLMAVQDLVNEKLATMRAKHDQTLEWLRLGALKGIVQDGSGNTILNIYTDFGVAQPVVAFVLTTAGTDVRAKCRAVKRQIETNLNGDVMTYVRCVCSPTFYDALVSHATVTPAFANWNAAQNLYTDYRKGFMYEGIEFIEYNGSVNNPSGAAQKMIADDEAYFFPMGTQNTFRTYFAPADFIEAVNTPGLNVYAKQMIMDFERGVMIHTQSNPLPMCLRPLVMVKGTK
jgi:hypothetical protein